MQLIVSSVCISLCAFNSSKLAIFKYFIKISLDDKIIYFPFSVMIAVSINIFFGISSCSESVALEKPEFNKYFQTKYGISMHS